MQEGLQFMTDILCFSNFRIFRLEISLLMEIVLIVPPFNDHLEQAELKTSLPSFLACNALISEHNNKIPFSGCIFHIFIASKFLPPSHFNYYTTHKNVKWNFFALGAGNKSRRRCRERERILDTSCAFFFLLRHMPKWKL